MQEKVVLHLQPHQKGVEARCGQDDYRSNFEEGRLPLEASSKKEPHQRRAFEKEEGLCGQALAPQACLVGREHALGV